VLLGHANIQTNTSTLLKDSDKDSEESIDAVLNTNDSNLPQSAPSTHLQTSISCTQSADDIRLELDNFSSEIDDEASHPGAAGERLSNGDSNSAIDEKESSDGKEEKGDDEATLTLHAPQHPANSTVESSASDWIPKKEGVYALHEKKVSTSVQKMSKGWRYFSSFLPLTG